MDLNQLKKLALEKLAEEKKASQKSRKLRLEGERKRKISVLKNKLAAWGINVTHWRYTQFTIDGILFILREERSRYDLVARKKCKSCKAQIYSFPVVSLIALGRVLANDNCWDYHECRPKKQPVAPPVTKEQRAYRLLQELAELMYSHQIDPSHIDNWPPQ